MGRKEEAIVSFLTIRAQTVDLCVDSQRRKLEDAAGFPLDHSGFISTDPKDEVSHGRQFVATLKFMIA